MLTGLAVVSPEKIPVNPLPPSVIIERVRLDGQTRMIPGDSQLLGDEIGTTNISKLNQKLEIPPQHHELKN